MKTVLIIGASQGIGRATVTAALDAGYRVKAFSRHAQRDITIGHENLETIEGDALSGPDVRAAVDGCDAVITTLGMSWTLRPVYLFSQSMRGVIRAMEETGVKRLIAVTGLGAGNSKGVGPAIATKLLQPLVLGRIYEDKDREELLVRQSRLDWTIVRPGVLTRLPARGEYEVLVEPETWRSGFVSRDDVADFLVKQIEDDTLYGKTPAIVG